RLDEQIESRATHPNSHVRRPDLVGTWRGRAPHPARRSCRDQEPRLARGLIGVEDEAIQDNRRRWSNCDSTFVQKLELRCARVGSANILIREHSVTNIDGTGSTGESAGYVTLDRGR